MKGLLRHIFPLSLRVRFLLATAGVVLVLSLAYGMVALVGYSVSFDKTTFRLLRGESNLFYMLARWENGAIDVDIPENLNMESPTVTLIYDEQGKLLWAQRDVPWLAKRIQPEWLKRNGFHEIEADVDSSSMLLRNNHEIQEQLDAIREQGDDSEMTHSVAINLYPATSKMPQLSIVVVDTIPVELKRSYMVWSWFGLCAGRQPAAGDPPCCGSPPGGACGPLSRWPKRCANWRNITAKSSIPTPLAS
ncbi:sensor protein PhoQ [Klebsiella pneumoniae]|nr:sensor protein PhoQ [Klebsiella pneumoniae]